MKPAIACLVNESGTAKLPDRKFVSTRYRAKQITNSEVKQSNLCATWLGKNDKINTSIYLEFVSNTLFNPLLHIYSF